MIPVSEKFLGVKGYNYDSLNLCFVVSTSQMQMWLVNVNGEWAWLGGSFQGLPIAEELATLVKDQNAAIADGMINVGGTLVNGVMTGGTNYEIIQGSNGVFEPKVVQP